MAREYLLAFSLFLSFGLGLGREFLLSIWSVSGDYSLVTCNYLLFLYFSWIQITCFWSLVSIIIQCSSLSGKKKRVLLVLLLETWIQIDNHQVSELLGHLLGQPKLLALKLNTFSLFLLHLNLDQCNNWCI